MKERDATENDEYIQERYRSSISYYWGASRSNKKWYKTTRSSAVIGGALVTLMAALSSSTIIDQSPSATIFFVIGTPVLAALLTIITGFSQSFQFGSAWHTMVLTAQRLQAEYDRYLITPEDQRDYAKEAEILNTYIITESEGFFERMLGGPTSKSPNPSPRANEESESEQAEAPAPRRARGGRPRKNE